MITVVYDPTPTQIPVPAYSLSGGSLAWHLDSTLKHLCSMRYVADLYVPASGATALSRTKYSPNTEDGHAFAQMARIVQNQLGSDPQSGLTGHVVCPRSCVGFSVAFGEETDGTLGCTGTSFSVTMGPTGSTAYAYNGAVQYGGTYDEAEWTVLNGATAGVRFLTDSPAVQSVTTDEEAELYYLSYLTGATAHPWLEVTVKYLNNPLTTQFYVPTSMMRSGEGRVVAIGTGPRNLNDLATTGPSGSVLNCDGTPRTTAFIDCTVEWYEVFLADPPVAWPC